MIYHLAKIKEEDWDSFLEWICTYEYKYLEIPVPDLVLYLRVPIDISQKLMVIMFSMIRTEELLKSTTLLIQMDIM